MRMFLTGGTGFIGAETLRLGLEAGHEMLVHVRSDSAEQRLAPFVGQFERLDLDLNDGPALTNALTRYRPEVVLHLAWSGVANHARFDRRQFAENIAPNCSLVEAASVAGASAFIAMGSQGEYGANSAMREDSLPEPTSLYGAAKVATLYLTRQLAAQAGMRHAWLRLFSTYGPGDNDGWLIPMLITEMLAGRRPRMTLGTQYWDWLHVEDVARAVLAVAAAPTASGVFNLGSGRAERVRDVTERVRDLAAPGMDLVFGEIPFRPDQVMHMEADISRLRAATGWQPRISLEKGLEGTVAWYRKREA